VSQKLQAVHLWRGQSESRLRDDHIRGRKNSAVFRSSRNRDEVQTGEKTTETQSKKVADAEVGRTQWD
jgi:hypothetical protein